MKNRSLMKIMCAGLAAIVFAGTVQLPVGAVARSKQQSTQEEASSTNTETEGQALNASADESVTSGSGSSKSSSKSSGSKNSTPKVDEKGNTILMTQAQRHRKFASKTNPKRGVKPVTLVYKPNFNGFTYADFATCNSYNSENGLGGHPIYLLGTITDIEKVYENALYYGTAILVNDIDGYQWYMRADINKAKYDLFRNSFIGKTGYIYGIYSGYSGVTDRPMMDITVLQPNGMVPFDMKLYK